MVNNDFDEFQWVFRVFRSVPLSKNGTPVRSCYDKTHVNT